MQHIVLDPSKIRDLAPLVLDENRRMRILPAAFWATTTVEERALFGNVHGIYSFPTTELVERIREIIGARTAIEIGAGNGVLADALDIVATDTREQEQPAWRAIVALSGGRPVRYGPNVVELSAADAVRHYRPQVVVAQWVTQDFDPTRPLEEDAKYEGVDEDDIIDRCETYVLVGNQKVHQGKRIWKRPHTVEYPPWLYSRAFNGTPNFIATWQGRGVRRTRTRTRRG